MSTPSKGLHKLFNIRRRLPKGLTPDQKAAFGLRHLPEWVNDALKDAIRKFEYRHPEDSVICSVESLDLPQALRQALLDILDGKDSGWREIIRQEKARERTLQESKREEIVIRDVRKVFKPKPQDIGSTTLDILWADWEQL